jgi:hypothetical protein
VIALAIASGVLFAIAIAAFTVLAIDTYQQEGQQ